LAGAELNAFYAQGKRALPDNLAVMVHDVTHSVLEDEEEVQENQVLSGPALQLKGRSVRSKL
jgi:hypothetical protein